MAKQKRKRAPESFKERNYRALVDAESLVASYVTVKDTDLQILADRDVKEAALNLVMRYRLQIESYIDKYPVFASSLVPLPEDRLAPPIVKDMLTAGICAGVGPMAALAGCTAKYVGRVLLAEGCAGVVVKNGGDIFCARKRDCLIAIFAGESSLSMQVGLRIHSSKMPLGICTSSGTVGHSLSFGCSDSVTVIGDSAALADAAATRLGNEVGAEKKAEIAIKNALQTGQKLVGVRGIIVVCGDRIGAVGDVELVSLKS